MSAGEVEGLQAQLVEGAGEVEWLHAGDLV